MQNDCIPRLLHRDISSGDSLLESEFRAVVSDFGTARLVDPDSSNQTLLAGTYGYVAPGNSNTFLDSATLGKNVFNLQLFSHCISFLLNFFSF